MTCSSFDESLIDELIMTASIDLLGLNICAFQVVNIVKIEFEKLAQANIFFFFKCTQVAFTYFELLFAGGS